MQSKSDIQYSSIYKHGDEKERIISEIRTDTGRLL